MNNLELGITAPNFNIIGSDDKIHKLSDYIGKKVILFFYPKDNTPGWKNEALSFKDNYKALEELNCVILGISRDSIQSHKKFIEKNQLNFILLSDENEEVSTNYETLKSKNIFGKKCFGIERSTFIINEEGILESIFRKVKVQGHVESILSSLK